MKCGYSKKGTTNGPTSEKQKKRRLQSLEYNLFVMNVSI